MQYRRPLPRPTEMLERLPLILTSNAGKYFAERGNRAKTWRLCSSCLVHALFCYCCCYGVAVALLTLLLRLLPKGE
jgi:hypothetical protein